MNNDYDENTGIGVGKEQGHTPTPWRENGQTIFAKDGSEICTCGDVVHDEHQANARFICKAVNCHADLVAALKRLLELCEAGEGADMYRQEQARAALKKERAS